MLAFGYLKLLAQVFKRVAAKVVLVASGTKGAYALKNAIGQAIKYIDSGFIDIVSQLMKDGENND